MSVLMDFLPLHHIIDELKPHVARHYNEMTEADNYGQPDIDWDVYRALSHAGYMVAATLRDSDELVGYIIFSLNYNQRHMKRLEASNEGLFIESSYRPTWSRALVKYALSMLAARGVQETNFALSDERVGRWLGSIGAESTYKIWSFHHGQ